jgi:hypothetical protein
MERAYQLADSGKPFAHIRAQMAREGYDPGHLHGPTIRKQLAARIATAKKLPAH